MARRNVSYCELTNGDILRIIFVPIIWLIYCIVLCARMSGLAICKDSIAFIVISVVWFLLFVAVQIYFICNSVANYDNAPFKYTWINVPLLLFNIFFIGPYCFAMYHTYKLVDMTNVTEVPHLDFFILQIIMPVIVIGNIFYPLPIRPTTSAGTASVIFGFLNAFDIMDVIGDLKYIQHMELGIHVWFYVAVIVSIILLAFPIGLDEDDEDDPLKGKITKSIFSLIFTEISFCILRGLVMHSENSIENGLVFAFKNAISACINIFLLLRVCCCRSSFYDEI